MWAKIVNLIPRDRGSCAGVWLFSEHAIFFLLFLSTLGYESDNWSVYSNNDQGRVYQDSKYHYMYYRGWGFSARAWLYKSKSLYWKCLSSTLSIYIILISIILNECFPTPLLIFIYSMIGQLISKYELFWQEVSLEFQILSWLLRSFDSCSCIHRYNTLTGFNTWLFVAYGLKINAFYCRTIFA